MEIYAKFPVIQDLHNILFKIDSSKKFHLNGNNSLNYNNRSLKICMINKTIFYLLNIYFNVLKDILNNQFLI